jgi:hypothetical protein
MKLLIQSSMIFFGTLLAAGLLALGEPDASRARALSRDPAQAAPVETHSMTSAEAWFSQAREAAQPDR